MTSPFRSLALTLAWTSLVWQAAPERASLRITGIVEGNPTEADSPAAALTLYKSLEFFSDSGVSSSELMKYALRRFNDANPAAASTFQLNPSGNASLFLLDNEFGFAVANTDAFRDLYFAGGIAGQNWANNTGQTAAPYPRILVSDLALASSGGNEVYQLLYYPGGFGTTPGHTFQVIDTFGILGDSGASTWDYELSFAYRTNASGPDGSTYNPGNWMFGEAGMFQDDPLDENDGFDFEGHSSQVPFGTFSAVPEPAGFALFALGLGVLARLRKAAPRR